VNTTTKYFSIYTIEEILKTNLEGKIHSDGCPIVLGEKLVNIPFDDARLTTA
jgi:hypothetical protein